MFGYILPEKPELKIKEYEIFKAYYCGVCKSIGQRYGQIPRITLNYDATFLALLLSSVAEEKIKFKKERCIVHPVKKRIVIKNSDIIDYASDINIILAYYNLKDNWTDEKSFLSAAGMIVLKAGYKKIKNKFLQKCNIIESRLNELSLLEKQKCNSMDEAAEPFAKLMEEITAYTPLCKDEKIERVLRWIGYNLGKWIYILDAYDDLDSDIKEKNYNPLVYQFNYAGEDVDRFKLKIKDRIIFNLTFSLNQIAKAYELLSIKNNAGIIENIIYMGMLRKTEQIMGIGSCKKVEESV